MEIDVVSRVNSASANLGSTATQFAPPASTSVGRNDFESRLSGSGGGGSHATPTSSAPTSPTESRPSSPYGASLLDEYGASSGSRPGTPTGGPTAHTTGSLATSPAVSANNHSFNHASDMEMGNIHHGHGSGVTTPTPHGQTSNGEPATQQPTHSGSTNAPDGTEPKKSWSDSLAAFGDKLGKVAMPATATAGVAGTVVGIISLATRKQ